MSLYRSSLFLLTALIGAGCTSETDTTVSGSIDYIGSSEIYVSKQPVHYKYAKKIQFPVNAENGEFSLSIPIDSTQIINFNIDDEAYPLIVEPGKELELKITRSQFPDSVDVAGYPEPWDEQYAAYQKEIRPLEKQIENTLPAFRDGEKTQIPSLYKKRYELARNYFQHTPLNNVYHKKVGEYLVKRLEEITYSRGQKNIDPEEIRQNVLNEAKDLNFFTFESLHAQRAGIRDFTHAFANTFGVSDSLEKEFNQELTQYDVKRLGYQKLDSARTSVLQYIPQRKALAYSKMHLIAERIGEMPIKVAKPSYEAFLEEYSDFPEYTSFLKTFYAQIERVSPGQPAISFSIPNKNENIVEMEDFEGKYVLLDFWASWCIPCLDEFPHMNDLYEEYSRDEFEIIAISIEEDSLRWRQALQQFDNPWPQLYAGNGFQQKTFKAYRGGGIPFYILVGPQGNIIRYNDARPSFNLPTILDSLITKP